MEQGPDELSGQTVEGVAAGAADRSEGARARLEAERGERSGRDPDPMDEGSLESFPASDPPSETSPAE